MQEEYLKIEFDITEEIFDDSVNKQDFKNAIAIDDLTEDDINNIINAFDENLKKFEFMKIFETIEENPNINLPLI